MTIFISYARVDDQTAATGAKGWVTAFEKHLQIALDKRVGRMGVLELWRDLRGIDGSQVFDRTIEEALDGSAVLIALTSNGYLASQYCLKELSIFHGKASKDVHGLTIGDRRRILNLLLNNVGYRDWPKEHEGTSGFAFHDAERKDQRGEPSEPDSPLFKQQLRPLADALYEVLKSLKQASKTAKEKAPVDERPCTVFLADVTDGLRQQRRRLVADLEQHQVRVLTDVPPPFALQDHDRDVNEALRRADLSVHLLDGVAGREVVVEILLTLLASMESTKAEVA